MICTTFSNLFSSLITAIIIILFVFNLYTFDTIDLYSWIWMSHNKKSVHYNVFLHIYYSTYISIQLNWSFSEIN